MIMEISAVGLGFSYDDSRKILKNIDIVVKSGEVTCILGPNGVGKTTLLFCLANLLDHDRGRITMDGRDMKEMTRQEVARMVGFVPQMLQASFDYTVLEYVVTGHAPWLGTFEKPGESAYHKAMEALEQMEIAHLANKPYTRLSGGELQQVSIARAITQQARFIFMDEPTAHLDYGNQLKVLRIVKELAKKGYGIVMTTHNPDQVLLLEGKVGVFDREGSFQFGPWEQILSDELLSTIYNAPIQLRNVEGITRKICIPPGLDQA